MTKFDELQQIHQHLLDQMDQATDKPAFTEDVRQYVARVCDEAVDVPAPRDRDQLRANLRYWGSYLYDATGTYPNTNMRPARLSESAGSAGAPIPQPDAPQPKPAAPTGSSAATPAMPPPVPRFGWRTWLVLVIVVVLVGGMFLSNKNNSTTFNPTTTNQPSAVVQPTAVAPNQTLTVTWRIVTTGPSPFFPAIWVARVQLLADGGNGEYIFWANGQRLPETNRDQFTVESQGCQPISQMIGVTSDGQSAKRELIIYPIESSACPR